MANATESITASAAQRSAVRWNQRSLAPWLFLAPGLFMFGLYVLWPIVQSVTLSFYDWDGLYGPNGEFKGTFVGMGNYAELMIDPAFETSLVNNFYWLALYLLALPIGLFIAIFLNQTVTGIRLYKSLFFFPFVISQVVVGLIFAWFYAPNFGLFYLLTEAITGKGVAVLADPDLVTFGIIAAGLWPQIAYVMILYLTGLNNVAPDQIEAARLDGAKGLKMLWYVVLPQLRPATFIAVIVTVIGALRSFDLVSIMTNGGPFGSSRVLSYYMYEKALGEYGFRMGYGAAIAVVLFAIMMIFISGFIWKMWRDETQR
ncbi:sugar ABC transporter permease [Tabrizicola piscis]|uniref:Sugar ABC transporter permease n=1 Tax=Tabrizicola piscis TaxID=2494374 RepID=A0A3S8U7V8_9RHOB|nr:sugar ABC transporter permease [Tabrizicola piscis]AZL59802.1 sugar ABC transporter permease [Tabrizicola piscis]